MKDNRYRVAGPSVASEVIDGEAIIMDLKSGNYYSADGLGAAIWEAIEDGASVSEISAWIEAAYPAEAGAGEAAAAFIAELSDRGLIEPIEGFAPSLPAIALPWAPPALQVHDDMQDLIMLDPIHDVDAMGWPTRKAEPAE